MAEIIIPRKYYDGSYCPKCLSINYDIYDIELDYSRRQCIKCNCEWEVYLKHGDCPIKSNIYHYEVKIVEKEDG